MAIQVITKVMRAVTTAESQLTSSLLNYERAIRAYNINGIAAQIASIPDADPVVSAEPNSITKAEFVDALTLGATAVKLLLDVEGSGGNTLLESPALDQTNAGMFTRKLAV